MSKCKYDVYAGPFEIEIEAFEVVVTAQRSQESGERAARTMVAALIEDALSSLMDKGVNISVYDTSGYRSPVSFKSHHFHAAKVEGGE